MKRLTPFLWLALLVLILSGCAPALRVDRIQAVVPDIQMRKKYPLKVALIVPPATRNINTVTISRSKCIGGVTEVVPYPFGQTFTETAIGTFSKMFSEVDVINGLPAEKEYDLILETTLASLTFKNGCDDDPGNFYEARGTVKLLDNDYREIWSGSQGAAQGWAYWNADTNPAGPVIGNVLSTLVKNYAQAVNMAPQFVQLVKDRNKPKEQYASGAPPRDAPPAPAIKSDVDALPPVKVSRALNAYAIVIGIEGYRQKLPKADFAVSDAKLMGEYLTKVMGYPEENVVMLTNEHATKSDFEKYFERWLSNNVEKNSTVFIYYSGHGAPDPKTGGAYLVPYDGDPSFIAETGYPLKRMYDALGKLQAKEIIVALDSCFSGAGGRSVIAKGARPLVMNLERNMALSGNMTVLSASAGEQISSTYDEKGHGLFTYFLLKGIKNEDVVKPDGSIRMDDLFGYVKPQVERIARKQYNNEQTPQLIEATKK